MFLMADYGHDPTGISKSPSSVYWAVYSRHFKETAIPWQVFTKVDFECSFATENGATPICDEKMLKGLSGALLGAPKAAKVAYEKLSTTDANFQKPLSWTSPDFSLDSYDLVFLPGGHDKGVRQIIDSKRVQALLASYFPLTAKPSKKTVVAICHGVQVLSGAEIDGKSVLHDVQTTALPHAFEQGIYHATRLWLGDYYKTYGGGSDSVEQIVTNKLDDPKLFVSSLAPTP